jgi:hypothetical protein
MPGSKKKPEGPSPEQAEVLRRLVLDKQHRLFTMRGGFWTTHSTELRDFDPKVPVWHTGVLTVRAMEKKGWLKRTFVHPEGWRDERELTEAGLAAAAPKETP